MINSNRQLHESSLHDLVNTHGIWYDKIKGLKLGFGIVLIQLVFCGAVKIKWDDLQGLIWWGYGEIFSDVKNDPWGLSETL